MSTRPLIVTADDFGASSAIDRGICDAVRAGRVSAVSVLANGPTVHAAVDALPRHVAVGAHLNVTEYIPVAPLGAVTSLVCADGRFLPLRLLLLRATLGLLHAEHVADEVTAQIACLRALGFIIRYADSHQHVHAHPRLAGPVAAAARSAGIGRIRRPVDPTSGPGLRKARALMLATRLSASAYVGFFQPVTTRGIAR